MLHFDIDASRHYKKLQNQFGGKMKMKKLISIALILTMTFSMAACGERDSSGDDQATNDSAVTQEVGEDVPPAEPEDVVTDEEVASITEESPEDLAA